ncbi:SRPBCC family protein [Arthrobacter sp. I2-34]|uniref:SRPBCC family protein n=1 Tax=Arthrobacter hankyongi TaxID=2904801 RepID=A0ABS9L2D7_9MICC|nr:SRPBCC family protein [Arthrobacter hankyongi]MCG2620813.1 SRPBCC family protein [Arthrobacter hankyongi]
MNNALQLTSPQAAPYSDYKREFDFPAAAVFRAHADPALYGQWIGPRGLTTRVEQLDCRSGGSFRFVQHGDDGVEHAFHGVFHTVRDNEFILMTFEYEGFPDVVTLEYTRFEDLAGGRCRLAGHSVFPTLEDRERYLAGGMESGMAEGYDRLEELLGRAG